MSAGETQGTRKSRKAEPFETVNPPNNNNNNNNVLGECWYSSPLVEGGLSVGRGLEVMTMQRKNLSEEGVSQDLICPPTQGFK